MKGERERENMSVPYFDVGTFYLEEIKSKVKIFQLF